MPNVSEKRAEFRSFHENGFFLIPNPWDAGSARRLAALGFKALASTSGGAAWAVGKEDGELTLGEVLNHLSVLVDATDLPINADFENGYADAPEDLARNVAKAVETGIAGLSIEDWSGDKLYDFDLAVERILAARAAIDAVDPSAMLIGRHEQFRAPDMSFADSLARTVAYAEAGADCLFVPGIFKPDEVAELVQAVAPKPFSLSVYQFDDSIAEYATIGVRRFSTGGTLAAMAYGAMEEAAKQFKNFES